MSVRLMTLAFEADLSEVKYTIPAHVAPATGNGHEKIIREETGTLSSGDKFVLVALADNADDDGGSIFPSVETLSEKTQQTGRGCRSALRHLEGAKLLDLEHEEHTLWIPKKGLRRTRTYRINVDLLATFRRPEKKRTPELSSGLEGVTRNLLPGRPGTGFRGNPELGSSDSSEGTISRNHQKKQKQNPAPRNGAAKSAQAVQVGGLLPGVAGALEAGLEVPTGSARPVGPTRVAAAAAGAPDPAAPVATAPISPAAARGPVPRDLLIAFDRAYTARFGVRHPKMGGQEAALAKGLLEQYGLPKCLEFVEAFFTVQDAWLERTGKGFKIFAMANIITKLIALPTAVPVGRPASISEKWAGAKPGLVSL